MGSILSFDQAYLGLEEQDLVGILNPFFQKEITDDYNLQLEVIRLMRNPRYIAWTCKVLFNIELLPIQMVIMKELFWHPFPMFIASRGFGKCQDKTSYIVTSKGYSQIQDLLDNNPPFETKLSVNVDILGEKGFHKPKYIWRKKPTEYHKIITRYGFELKGSLDHPIRCVSNGEIIWKKLSDINHGDYIVIDRNKENFWPPNVKNLDNDIAYFFGALIGDGGYTQNRITFTNQDPEVIKRVNIAIHKLWRKQLYQNKKRSCEYYIPKSSLNRKELFEKYGFNSAVCSEKDIPKSILCSTRENMIQFLRGYFDADGSADVDHLGINIVSKSVNMIKRLQFILTRFGIIGRIRSKWNKRYKRYYYCYEAFGENAINFATRIGFGIRSKQHKLERLIPIISWSQDWQFLNDIYNQHYFYDKVVKIEKGYSSDLYDFFFDDEDHSYLSNGFISHNSFLLALYGMYKMALFPGTKAIVVGAAFRQAKVIFEYMETIWYNAPVLRSICTGRSGPRRDIDRCTMTINDSAGICLPLGDGQKIRGQRSSLILCDEFASINPTIYETVIQGFGVVSKTPIEHVRQDAKREAMKNAGEWTDQDELEYGGRIGNQAILSGTASYSFNHFYSYWQRYKTIIECKGDIKKIKQKINDEEMAETLAQQNYKDYCIIRIPYDLIPKGFMDEKQVLRAKAGLHTGIFNNEYQTIFSKDSQGFFKRSLIESIVANHDNLMKETWPKYCSLPFDPKIHGSKDYEYVFGVDPASEEDNFAIVIIELHSEHQRVVHTWTTNRTDFQNRQKAGLTDITDYYGYCVRKIRDLMASFPCVRIGIDSQGGGHAIIEGLHDKDKMYQGELPLWEIIEPDKKKETDHQAGLHIIEVINFVKYEWTSTANHGLRKDMEDKILLLPRFDSLTLSLSNIYDQENFDRLKEKVGETTALKLYDTLEDCALEIESLKDELATIVMTQTGIVGRDRWDVPEVKLADGKKGRLRKDRYSACLIANMLARQIYRTLPGPAYQNIGRIAGEVKQDTLRGQLYTGPEWAKQYDLRSIHVVRR